MDKKKSCIVYLGIMQMRENTFRGILLNLYKVCVSSKKKEQVEGNSYLS